MMNSSIDKWTHLLIIVATWLGLIALVSIIVYLASFIHHTILLFALGALLAYALDPVVEAIRRPVSVLRVFAHKSDPATGDIMPRGLAITIVFVVVAILLGVGIGMIAHQVRYATNPKHQELYRENALELLGRVTGPLDDRGVHLQIGRYLADPSSMPPNVRSTVNAAELSVLLVVKGFFISIGEGVIVLLIAAYLLIYGAQMRLLLNKKLPRKLLAYAQVWEEDINRIIGGFVRGQLIIALLLGSVSALACFVVGLKLWLLIGLFVVVASLIPVFGPYISAVPAIILTLIGPTRPLFHTNLIAAVVLLIYFVIVNEFASKILYPRLVGHAIGLHEVLVLFVIFAGLEIGGVAGVLFAAPVTAMIVVSLVHLYRFWQDLPDSLMWAGATASKQPPLPGVVLETAMAKPRFRKTLMPLSRRRLNSPGRRATGPRSE